MARQFYNNANCMGYAFGKNKWAIPHGWYESLSDGVDFVKRHFAYKATFYAEYDKEEGHKLTELPLGKSFIVMRVSEYYNDEYEFMEYDDFHFIRRLPTGHWRHKPGRRRIVPISQKIVVKEQWPNDYNSNFFVFELL